MGTRRRWIAYVLAAAAALLLAGAPAALAGGSGGAAGLQPAAGFQPFQELQLSAFDGAAGDMLGTSVAYSGGVTIAGAPARAVGGNAAQGAAVVFWHSGELYEQSVLTASDGATEAAFGYSVALDGDTAVVGAPGAEEDGLFNLGAVYVFVRNGGAWVQQAKLTAPDRIEKSGFGLSVAIDGDTLVVGEPSSTADGHVGQGAAYVFTRTGDVWSQPVKLTASDGTEGDGLGICVSVSGDTVVSGAPARDVGGSDAQGAVYVFTRSGGVWSQQAELTASDGSPTDLFGWSCDVDGDTLLVGALGVSQFRGSSYVFTRSGATWTQQIELEPTDGHALAQYGNACAVSGDLFVVGSAGQTVGANEGQGAVYAWRHAGSEWLEGWTVEELTASDGAAGDIFGFGVAVKDGTVAVGAPRHAVDGAAEAGAAYLYAPPVGPDVAVSRPGGGWHKRTVKLAFTATPAENGAPVAATQYWIDGVSHMWTDAKSLRVTQQGVVHVQVRAVDVNGTPGASAARHRARGHAPPARGRRRGDGLRRRRDAARLLRRGPGARVRARARAAGGLGRTRPGTHALVHPAGDDQRGARHPRAHRRPRARHVPRRLARRGHRRQLPARRDRDYAHCALTAECRGPR